MSQETNATIAKRGVRNDDAFQGVVQELHVLSTSPLDLERSKKAESLLFSIGEYSDNHGTDPSSLSSLITLLTRKSSLPESALINLLGHLYPRAPLPEADLLAIVNCVGKGYQKVDQKLQDTLLQWLACLYPVLSDVEKETLDKCYSALWLGHSDKDDCGGLRALLAQMTRKCHVTPLRMKMCTKSIMPSVRTRNTGDGRGLLFFTMKIYRPRGYGLIMNYKARREKLWELLDSKKAHQFKDTRGDIPTSPPLANGNHEVKEITPSAKRIKLSHPVVNGPGGQSRQSPSPSSQSQNPGKLIELVERAVANPMFCKLGTDLEDRFNHYLGVQAARLTHQVYTEDNLERILALVTKLIQRTKHASKPVLKFVRKLLLHKRAFGLEVPSPVDIFGLLPLDSFATYEPRSAAVRNLDPDPEIYQNPLLGLFQDWFEEFNVDETEDSLITLLQMYTRSLSSWFISWKGFRAEKTLYLFKPFEILHEHVSTLILRILSTFKGGRSHRAVLSYFAVLADLASLAPKDHFVRVLRPESLSVYILALSSPSLRSLEGQLSLLADFKNSFEAALLVSRPEGLSLKPYDREYVNRFNGFLMDLCNMLWRNRAFNSSDANARGCLIADIYLSHLKQYTENLLPPQILNSILALSFHPTLAALSIGAFQELEDEYISNAVKPLTNGSMTNGTNNIHQEHDIIRHAGPVSQRSLSTLRSEGGADISWIDYRIHVLDWLADRGAVGIREMMEGTMKTAMASRKRPSDASSA